MDEVVVIKLNVERQETWRYNGRVLSSHPNEIFIEAFFNRDDLPFHGIILGRGDRFLEKYYSDRWYNIFEIRDRLDDHLKGWYCNVTRPAEFRDGQISYVDLALDLLVFPDGRQLVLDEDEFALLSIDDTVRNQAQAALAELQRIFHQPQNFQLQNS
jgi:uncharacterized protein